MARTVLLVADYGVFGGTRSYLNILIDFYEKHGFTVYLAVENGIYDQAGLSFPEERMILLPELNIQNPQGILHSLVNIGRIIQAQVLTCLKLWLELRKRRHSLVFVTTGRGDRYLSLLMLPIPCLYITHTTPQENPLNIFFRLLLQRTLNSGKIIIAVSEHMRNEIVKQWGSPQAGRYIRTVHHGLKPLKDSGNLQNGAVQKNVILTLGRVAWYKNPEMWISVAECLLKNPDLRKYQWVWAGDGELFHRCRSIVEAKKLQNVTFVGHQADVEQLYDKALLYFQPSILESFGLSVLDAMKSRIPCVVTRTGGLPELVVDGETGFIVENSDVTGAAEKIAWLLMHPEKSRQMGDAGFIRYNTYFTEEIWVNNMKKIHNEVFQNDPENLIV
jgi:glycosyltransferase involved in cell wall biosynthesis